jgi:hypothetical protein
MSTFDEIGKLQQEVLETADMPPHRAAAVLVELTGHYFRVVALQREAQFTYDVIEAAHVRAEDGVLNRGKAKAKLTQEYKDYRVASDYEKTTMELIRSLKKFMSTMQEEMRLSR